MHYTLPRGVLMWRDCAISRKADEFLEVNFVPHRAAFTNVALGIRSADNVRNDRKSLGWTWYRTVNSQYWSWYGAVLRMADALDIAASVHRDIVRKLAARGLI